MQHDGFRERSKHRLVILGPRGDDMAYLSVPSDRFHTLNALSLDVFDANGKKVYTRKQSDWERACGFGPSFSLYSDVCWRYLRADGPGYPYTIEWEAEWHSNSLFFWNEAAFQQDVPVVRAVYELKCPASFKFQHKSYGLDLQPIVRTDGDKQIYLWEAGDISARALQGDDLLTPEHEDYARIDFAPESFSLDGYKCNEMSWDAIAAWYRELAADRYLTPGTNVVLAPLGDAWRATAAECYKRVVDRVRYVSISIGVGGWQPHAASETENRAYGDCKDLSTLLISYLRQAGITAYPVLIMTRDAGWTDPSFPTSTFNHVITVAVESSDTLWMDPTCEQCSCGDIPDSDEDTHVLVVTDDSGVLVKTPASWPEENSLRRTSRVHVSSGGIPTLNSRWEASGNAGVELSYSLLRNDPEERTEFFKNQLTRAVRHWSVDMTEKKPQLDSSGRMCLNLVGKTNQPLIQLDKDRVLSLFCFDMTLPQEALVVSERTLPLDLGYPSETIDSVIVTWDRGLFLDTASLLPDSSRTTSFASCALRTRILGDSVVAVFHQKITDYVLPPTAFGDFVDYCASRKRLANTCLRLSAR